jgi:hypothetical protein
MLMIAFIIAVQPAMAITQMAIPFITTCDTIYMEPTEFADLTLVEFNSASMSDASTHTLNIDFPVFFDNIGLGPMVASNAVDVDGISGSDRASLNVLPFGPVNLAFPSISQTADETHTYERTYFYSDSI